MSKIFIGVAWPYANGPIHVGHMAGCNLPPDIFRKFHILRGNDVLMVSGSDMHGTPVTVGAEKEGITPQELAQKYHKMNDKALKDFGIVFDEFHSTEDPVHIETVSHLFKTIHENGYLYEKEMELPYCGECDRTLPDRYVEGECPFCHFENARGDQCEECGKLMDPDMLIDLRCADCGSTPEFVTRSHFFFKLSALEKELGEWMADKDYWRPHVLNFSRMFIEGGLKDRPVTRDTTYGIEIPFDGHDDKRIYVWFEAFMGYYTMAVKWAMDENGKVDQTKLDSFWRNPECRHYYFLGKDNIPFHTIFWPAVIKAFDSDKKMNLPYDVPGNALLRFGGQQFSKSRGVSVSIKDIIKEYDPDAMRYYMTSIMPENRDADFTWEDFRIRNNSELVATYGNFVHRTLSFTQKNFGQIPEGTLYPEAKTQIESTVEKVSEHLEKCEFKLGIKRAMQLARFGNHYIDHKAPWKQLKENKDDCANTLFTSLSLSKALAVIMSPFMPFSSQRLWESLGESGNVLDAGNWAKAIEPPISGVDLERPEPLFKKLEDIKMNSDKANEAGTQKIEKVQPSADWGLSKLDLRIGLIKEVHDHPDADKLIVMIIDLGDEERQLVAGLKEHYSKEELEGKFITAVCNLKPAKLRGIESQCMLLAATDDDTGKVSILSPEGDFQPGDQITGSESAKMISFPEFQKFRIEIGDGNKAVFISGEDRIDLATEKARISPDKATKAGSKVK